MSAEAVLLVGAVAAVPHTIVPEHWVPTSLFSRLMRTGGCASTSTPRLLIRSDRWSASARARRS
jgi:hypothetical protein